MLVCFGAIDVILSCNPTTAVVSRDMSWSQDTIFQSLGLEGLKPSVSSRSRHLEVSENGQVSAIFPIRA